MNTFKINYEFNDTSFAKDTIEDIQLLDIKFDIDIIKTQIKNKNNFFKCNIPLPLNIVYNNLMNYNIYIQFNDYLIKIHEKKLNISNEKFDKKRIIFDDSIQDTAINNFCNNDVICKIFIDMIESISCFDNFEDNINAISNILDRMYYKNIEESKLYNKLYNVFCQKLISIITNLNMDNINKDSDSFSLINELIEIIKLSKIDLSFKFENKEYILLEKIKKLVQDDLFIKNYDYDIKKFDDKLYDESKNFYCSSITRTNWIDEMEYKNITGLLVKIDPKEINKTAYNLDFIPIIDITHTIISLEQILEAYKVYHKTWNTLFDKDLGGTNIISGYGIGEGNCMIPLYISNEHWKLAKIYNEYNFGIIFNRNPLLSKNKYCDLYYNILSNMINLTFSNENYNSDKWIQLLFSMLRTVYELSKNDAILLNKFKKDKIYRIDCNINKILILCLFHGDNVCIRYVIEEQIRRKMKSIYRNISVLDKLYNFNNPTDAIKYEFVLENLNVHDIINDNNFNLLVEDLEENNIFSSLITTIHGIISMRNIILNIFPFIFRSMDDIGGILNEGTLNKLKNEIMHKLIKPTNFSLKSCINNKFSSHLNFTKNKKFKITTLYDNFILENDIQLKAIIIQSIIQRVDKCRRKAINNNKYTDSFDKHKFVSIIKNTGILISSRYIKNYYNLNTIFDYINLINCMDTSKIDLFLLIINIKKTVSLKGKLEENLNLIINFEKKEIINSYYKNGSFPYKYSSYDKFITN